jgi:membrane glycosyltransferase
MNRWLRLGAWGVAAVVLAWLLVKLTGIVFALVSWLVRTTISVLVAAVVLYIAYVAVSRVLAGRESGDSAELEREYQ